MSSLRETQAQLRDALLGDDATDVLDQIVAGGLSPAACLRISRHHVSTTLTDVLEGVYPVVCRLVDSRFFAYAADRFIAAHPPASPCLTDYGAEFPAFLASFEPCRHLVYLRDVARLEWALSCAAHADDATPLGREAIMAAASGAVDGLRLRFHPSVSLIESPWPIHRIWRATQPHRGSETVVDLASEGAWLEVRRLDDHVLFRALDPGTYVLRSELDAGRTLPEAADAALARDAGLDLIAALRDVFDDDIVVGFSHITPQKEDRA